ncbi:hypothetical protein ACVWYN_003338 [Pedobacter sp. UYP24]
MKLPENESGALFNNWRVQGPGVGTATEIEDGIEVHNTYVSFLSLENPMILVDGKEVNFVKTKMGLKLIPGIYPRVSGTSKVLTGDKAVATYLKFIYNNFALYRLIHFINLIN